MNNTAKIVAFPGDLSVGAGGRLTFQMSMPTNFVGKRFVMDVRDSATFATANVFINSMKHDNFEMIANGNTGIVNSTAFPPNLVFATAGAISATSNVLTFNESFNVADSFEFTVTNPFPFGVVIWAWWETSYGESCGCRKSR